MRGTRIVADALEIWAPVPRVPGAPTQRPVPESSLPIAVRKFQCPCMHANALLPFAMMFDVHVLCQQRPEKVHAHIKHTVSIPADKCPGMGKKNDAPGRKAFDIALIVLVCASASFILW